MASLPLITPSDCAVVLVDYQAGLAFGSWPMHPPASDSSTFASGRHVHARASEHGAGDGGGPHAAPPSASSGGAR